MYKMYPKFVGPRQHRQISLSKAANDRGQMRDDELYLAKQLIRAVANAGMPNTFLKFLTHIALKYKNVQAICVATVSDESTTKIAFQYGFSGELLGLIADSHLESNPLGKSICVSETLRFRDSAELVQEFPKFKQVSMQPGGSLIIPFETSDLLIGGAWLQMREPLANGDFEVFEIELVQHAIEVVLLKQLGFSPENQALNLSHGLLNEREQKVHELLTKGMSNYQIAKQLNISESWVKKLNQSIYKKLGISSRKEISQEDFATAK